MCRGTRPRKNRIEVWCDDNELALIKANALTSRLSNSEFLRNLGIGCEPKSVFDVDAIHELAKVHADQGRLGGLLKLWLSEKMGQGPPAKSVRSLLHEIQTLQSAIAKLVMQEASRL